jgi:Asparagine synthase
VSVAPPGMSTLEIAVGIPVGLDPPVPLLDVAVPPLEALEDAVADAVRRTPCCIAFSGGRDSSLVLAAAVRAAARHGCEQPVAVTVRFGRGLASDEGRWQSLVLDHLRVDNRVVIDVADDLDLVGPVASSELRRRGAFFPANCHALAPLVAHAAGGSLLVGLGGDELLGSHRWTRLNDALARRRRPRPTDLGRLAVAALPRPPRAWVVARRARLEPPRWLRPTAARRFRAAERASADEPVRFDRVVQHAARVRTVVVGAESLARLSEDVHIDAPLLDARFVSALARAGGPRGWGDRAAAMHAIAGGVLPDAILERRDKARFDAAYFGSDARHFAEEWTGGGIDPTLVDPEALRREWLEPRPDFRSALPLQLAWLHGQGLTESGG